MTEKEKIQDKKVEIKVQELEELLKKYSGDFEPIVLKKNDRIEKINGNWYLIRGVNNDRKR